MKSIFITSALVLFFFTSGFAQGFAGFISYLNSLPEEDRMAVVDSFMTAAEPYGFPYITGDSANFIYRGNVTSIKVTGDMIGWEPGFFFFAKVAGTDFYYRSLVFEMNARIEYKFIVNGADWINDPLNLNFFGANSELTMPGYIEPWEIESYPGVLTGTVLDDEISSAYTGKTYEMKVYLPHGYDPELPGGYPVAYFQDGMDYINMGLAGNVLDNLIDSGLCSPLIGIFVKPTNRNEEYAGSMREQYQQFFAGELLSYIDNKYNTIQEARARAVIGDSYGGNISVLICYNHPGSFGNIGLHSGALFPNNYEAIYAITVGEPVRWSSVWGSYEGVIQENMSKLKDSLLFDGYDVHGLELPEGHSWGLWRATIDEIIPYFFPPGFMDLEEFPATKHEGIYVYPNPARDQVTCAINLNAPKKVEFSLISLSGRVILKKSAYLGSGEYLMNLDTKGYPGGIYYLRILVADAVFTKKLVIYQSRY